MKLKTFITAFLVLVFVVQLLPVKQAVKYFLIDNPTAEELVHIDKGATKNFRLLDDDHTCMPEAFYLHDHLVIVNNILRCHFAETLPLFHAADVHTPPPNNV